MGRSKFARLALERAKTARPGATSLRPSYERQLRAIVIGAVLLPIAVWILYTITR
jgi:hypothetical protein